MRFKGSLVVLVSVLAFLAPISASADSERRVCVVPNVVGLKLAAARLRLANAHCTTGKVKWKFSHRPHGVVLAQDARAGAKFKNGRVVGLTVSKGEAPAAPTTPAPTPPAPPVPAPPSPPAAPAPAQIAPGSYKGATSEGNYVFFTVLPNRTITGFRINDLSETCDGPLRLRGGVDWSDDTFGVRADGSFSAEGNWTGSIVRGDAEYTKWTARLAGRLSGTSATGTVSTSEELKYKDRYYRCATGDVQWNASLLS